MWMPFTKKLNKGSYKSKTINLTLYSLIRALIILIKLIKFPCFKNSLYNAAD